MLLAKNISLLVRLKATHSDKTQKPRIRSISIQTTHGISIILPLATPVAPISRDAGARANLKMIGADEINRHLTSTNFRATLTQTKTMKTATTKTMTPRPMSMKLVKPSRLKSTTPTIPNIIWLRFLKTTSNVPLPMMSFRKGSTIWA